MGIQIEDGHGTSVTAKINSEGKLYVNAVTQSSEHNTNHVYRRAYNVLFSATPAGPDDCFFYMKNTSEIDIVVEGMWMWIVANEYIDVKIGDHGTPSGGADVTPVNLNAGSGNSADGIFQDGNDIINLSGGSISHRIYHASSNKSDYHNFNQDIIIPKNLTLSLYCQTGTTPLAGMLVINYHNAE